MVIENKEEISEFFINSDELVLSRENSVYDICRDRGGNLYIPDYRNNKIIIVDSEGSKKKVIDDVPFVHGLIVDRQDCLYAATYRNQRVFKFDKNYESIRGWDNVLFSEGLLGKPIAFAVTEENHLIMCDYEKMSILKLDSEGNLLLEFDVDHLRTRGEFLPHAACIDKNGNVYVTDRGDHRAVHRFSLEGQYLGVWASVNGWDPQCLKFLNEDIMMVAECTESKLYVYDLNGKILGKYGGKGHNPGKFQTCTNFVSDGQNYVYTVEQDSNRIQKLSHQTILSQLSE